MPSIATISHRLPAGASRSGVHVDTASPALLEGPRSEATAEQHRGLRRHESGAESFVQRGIGLASLPVFYAAAPLHRPSPPPSPARATRSAQQHAVAALSSAPLILRPDFQGAVDLTLFGIAFANAAMGSHRTLVTQLVGILLFDLGFAAFDGRAAVTAVGTASVRATMLGAVLGQALRTSLSEAAR